MNSKEKAVKNLEELIGVRLPSGYRQYLVSSSERLLEAPIVFDPPRNGVVDTILTIEDILENNEKNKIGIPEEALIHIGGNIMGGYLYLKRAHKGFGVIHYKENFALKEVFSSFEEFFAEPREKTEQ